jgi:hypothetical protein
VGTKLDAFVYDTLAAWYCEDDSAANCQTMPAAAATVRPQRAPAALCRAAAAQRLLQQRTRLARGRSRPHMTGHAAPALGSKLRAGFESTVL